MKLKNTIYYIMRYGRSEFDEAKALKIVSSKVLPDIAAIICSFAADLPPLPWIPPAWGFSLWAHADPEYDQEGNYGFLPDVPEVPIFAP